MPPGGDFPYNPQSVAALLREFGLRPDKRLGQNFLVDRAALEKIVACAEISASDTVLEIGPGLGGLTLRLAEVAARVVAVEVDGRLFPPLQQVLSRCQNVQLVHGDILELDPGALMASHGYLVVANIPYYITSAVIRHLLEASVRPRRLVLTVQREVAERICAAPGQMSLLALSVQVYGAPSMAARIPAGAFLPAPNVDSAVVRVALYDAPVIREEGITKFFWLAKLAFSQKRKTLRNTLAGGLHWETREVESLLLSAGIDPMRRAETLSLEEWARLVQEYQDLEG